MKSRARLMVAVTFLLALPAMLVGALRASHAADDVKFFVDVQSVSDQARQLQLRITQVRSGLWRYEYEPNVDSARPLKGALDELSRVSLDVEARISELFRMDDLRVELEAVRDMVSDEAILDPEAPLRRLRSAVGRVRRAVDPLIAGHISNQTTSRKVTMDSAALRRAHTALDTVARDAAAVAVATESLTQRFAGNADRSVTDVARDQIVLFLLLLFAFPLIVTLGPNWMIAPLARLRGVAQRIETGRNTREIFASGDDEIAEVVRSLRSALRRLEETDKKQRGKIFEMKRLIRALIGPLQDAVVIVNPDHKIAYANPSAAQLLGRETHHLESCPVDEACWSTQLQDAIERAQDGDVDEKGIDVTVETLDGRVMQVHVSLGTVLDQRGEVTRVVVVLRR